MSDHEFKKRFPAKFDPVIYAECKRIRMRLAAMYFAFGFIAVTTLAFLTITVLIGLEILKLPRELVMALAGSTFVQMGASVAMVYRFLFPSDKGGKAK